MPARKRKPTDVPTVADLCAALQRLAPLELAQDWDNVGLLVGDRGARVRRALLCIDLMPAVVIEAVRQDVQFIVAYHPPIFKAITRLTIPATDPTDAVFRCIAAGIAVYSTHTALDAADGGTNDVIANMCGLKRTHALDYSQNRDAEVKLVTFIPAEHVDEVMQALFTAGAGWIGDYDKCSYRISGMGTFRGGQSTNPTIGRAGRYETVDEIRVETVARRNVLPQVVRALRDAHPYEEPAFDIYPIQPEPRRGIGRYGQLPKPTSLATLTRRLKKSTAAATVQTVGNPQQPISRVIICVGAAGALPFKVGLQRGDVVVTGEIRHHDALAILRHNAAAIALGHWSSERPVLAPFRQKLLDLVPAMEVLISKDDREPFRHQ